MPMRDWDVVVVGSANMDYLIRAERLPSDGETLEGDVFDEAPGGKGFNRAVGVARLGGRVALVARLGTDERGDVAFERLVAEGVDARHVRQDPELGTGVALVMVDGVGSKRILAAPRANARLSRGDVRAASAALESCLVAVLDLAVPMEAVVEAARIAKGGGAVVILDPSPPQPLPEILLQQFDVIRPNAHEARVLTGIEVHDFESARSAAESLIARGVRSAVVGAGQHGDLLLIDGEERRLPRFDVPAVDTTGAGDAFIAALAMGVVWDLPHADAALLGSAAAALKTTRLGAQAGLPRRSELHAFIVRNRIELNVPRAEIPDRPPDPSMVPAPVAETAAPEDPTRTPGDPGAPTG